MKLVSVFLVAIKRLWNNKGLTLCLILGLVTAIALISSVPLYTDAANLQILEEKLSTEEAEVGKIRPPFAFMFRYMGSWHGTVTLDDIEPVTTYIEKSFPGIMGLPKRTYVRYVKTDNLSVFAASEAAYVGIRQPLAWVNLGYATDLEKHINLVDGKFPKGKPADPDVVEVAISQALANELGIQVGERYVIFRAAETPVGQEKASIKPIQFVVQVVGIWAPKDPNEEYWFYNTQALNMTLFLPEENFRAFVAPQIAKPVYVALWYTIFDGSLVRTDDVPRLLNRITQVTSQVSSILPNTVLDVSPRQALEKYSFTTFVMTIALYVFSIPILALVFYFISMISGLVVERQRGEIAILKSRGMGDAQVVGVYALEGLLVGAIGLAGGLFLGRQIALVMGNTISFLTFGRRQSLAILITPRVIRLALVGVIAAYVTTIWPALQAARLTIVTYKRERARSLELPFWQRYFLDFLLLIPCGYGYYLLKNRGTINFLANQTGGDPFQNPLLFLVPALTIIAVSLLLVRFFPLLMRLIAWVSGQVIRNVSVVLALRQLARVSKQYTGALLLLIMTVSLATFTASMARTLDQSLVDRTYYQYGADYSLVELGEQPGGEGGSPDMMGGMSSSSSSGQKNEWVFIPVSEHLKVKGIEAATRVGNYPAQVSMGGYRGLGRFYGIDRLDFPSVAFFRRDFSYAQLGTLMNRLALDPSAILVNPQFLADFGLTSGDRVPLSISILGEMKTIEFTIAGVITYFPTFYPEPDKNLHYLFVGNLDYLFEQMGAMFPYDVWIKTAPDADAYEIQKQLLELDIRVVSMKSSQYTIQQEQRRPERTGVFGILSVGFMAAAVLTLLGFLLHAFISFRRRYIDLGILRAIGLSVSQMIGFLGIEQLVIIAGGITAGTALGIGVSYLFIPFLQVSTARHFDIPPFVVLIAWNDITKIYVIFAAMLILAIAGMIWFLMRLKIFEAVKLGEAV